MKSPTLPTSSVKEAPELMKVPPELAAIRDLCVGRVEWQCCTDDGAYCMSFDHDNSRNPEREAIEWLERHQRDYPHRFMAYKVRRVVVQSQLQEEALALITRLSALQAAIKDRDAEIERLKKDARRYQFLRGRNGDFAVERYSNGWATCFGPKELDAAIDAAIDAMKGDAS